MVLHFEEKKRAVTDIQQIISTASSIVVANYQGTKVDSLSRIRRQAKDEQIRVRVVRNRLFKIAVEGTEFACLQAVCQGPMLLGVSYEDPGASARLFKAFAKTEGHFEVQAFAYGGLLFDAADLDKLALLPNQEEALTKVVYVLQAPIRKFATTLNAVPLKLAQVLTAVKDSKAA